MKKILIATRNKDKFRIVSKLLGTTIFSEYIFYNLDDLDEEIIDKTESGDVLNRAFEKAANVFVNIKNNDFDYIVGIDDVIKIKGKTIEDVKEYVNPIINDELLSEGEIIYMARAYTFFDQSGNNYTVLIDIPYKYKKLSYELKIEDNSYPLSHVLTQLNSDKTVVEQDVEEANTYYSSYSEEKFREVQEYFTSKKHGSSKKHNRG